MSEAKPSPRAGVETADLCGQPVSFLHGAGDNGPHPSPTERMVGAEGQCTPGLGYNWGHSHTQLRKGGGEVRGAESKTLQMEGEQKCFFSLSLRNPNASSVREATFGGNIGRAPHLPFHSHGTSWVSTQRGHWEPAWVTRQGAWPHRGEQCMS